MTPQVRTLADVDERARPAPAPRPAPVEPIELPDWINGATSWHRATVRLAEDLAREEAQIVSELRKVRQFRKLVDAVLERIEPPKGSTS